jgi:hypothetical protein
MSEFAGLADTEASAPPEPVFVESPQSVPHPDRVEPPEPVPPPRTSVGGRGEEDIT